MLSISYWQDFRSLGSCLPLGAAVQTIKLVHFSLRCKAADFCCINPVLNGLSPASERRLAKRSSNSRTASAKSCPSHSNEGSICCDGFSALRLMDKLYHGTQMRGAAGVRGKSDCLICRTERRRGERLGLTQRRQGSPWCAEEFYDDLLANLVSSAPSWFAVCKPGRRR
jgi:hypothetical protein